jgi:hypothetical protein
MNTADDTKTAQQLVQRLSLRRPRIESLDILAEVLARSKRPAMTS